jgi:UDPglucose 6-dehydrogenase
VRLGVVGLGKLGAPLAALLASKGHDVIGADLDERAVAAVNAGEPPVDETGLAELWDLARPRLVATTNVVQAAATADAVFIVVPTPSLPDRTFDVAAVVGAMRGIGEAVRADPGRRRVAVVVSTVMPGATNGPIRRALEESAGIAVGDTLGLCYSPEFIALGSVIADMVRPDFTLIGESSVWAGDLVAGVLAGMTGGAAPVRRMRIEEAELAKIAVNTFVTTKISFANMIAEICEALPGTDASVVTDAIGLDSRIGRRYLAPGPPYGGPCFPRDNGALAALARSLGTTADIAEATDRINARQVLRLAAQIEPLVDEGERVAVLGLAYKPATAVVDESFGVALARELGLRGIRVVVFDPVAVLPLDCVLDGVEVASSADSCLRASSVAVVTTAWPEFESLGSLLAGAGGPRVLFDYWRTLDPADIGPRSLRRPGIAAGSTTVTEEGGDA